MSRAYLHGGAYHALPDGCDLPAGVVELPRLPGQWEVWDGSAFAIAEGAVAALQARIDGEAEAVRQQFITAGSGQAMTYLRKEAEARAWLADNAAETPFLSAEAAATGTTLAQLAPVIVARADAWAVIGPRIEAARLAAKQAIAAATSAEEINMAAAVDWAAVVNAGN